MVRDVDRENMSTPNNYMVGVAFGLYAVLVGALSANAYTGQELAVQARVTIAQARQIALKAAPGNITDEELEKEGGGTGLRYSFDIKRGAKTYEVGVDAQTGKLLENKAEGPNPD